MPLDPPPPRPLALIALASICAALLGACGGSGQGEAAATSAAQATAPARAAALAATPTRLAEPVEVGVAVASADAQALGAAPVVRVLRDDRVLTLDLDNRQTDQAFQFWTMSGSPDDDAGFLVTWWPLETTLAERTAEITGPDAVACIRPGSAAAVAARAAGGSARGRPPALQALPVGGRWLVTGNRRVQLQPVDNDRAYRVRVQRLSARGRIASQAREFTVRGGDGTRVAALRQAMTVFDDFNLSAGAPDARLWNHANSVQTDPAFNLFFINDQFHAHTLHGTSQFTPGGDRSQTTQRLRKRLTLQPGTARRLVFDMDAPQSTRSSWYLDLSPVRDDLSGHSDFFDSDGSISVPGGVLRLRAGGQFLSAHLVGTDGVMQRIAEVDLQAVDRQMVPNVRRRFEVWLDTTAVRIAVDGKRVLEGRFAPLSLAAGPYDLLWFSFGYNTTKDGVPYFLHHWDNLGFDGPVADAAVVHDYVTRIEGTDYQKAEPARPVQFTVPIPDDLRPVRAGATAQAWLVWTHQMGDYSQLTFGPNDHVLVNGKARYPLPRPVNVQPPIPEPNLWGLPRAGRLLLGTVTRDNAGVLRTGDNQFRFTVENSGLLNVHVELHYPPGSEPAYTPPSAIHRFPMPADLPNLGPPVRLTTIGTTRVGGEHLLGNPERQRIAVQGVVPVNIEAGNSSWDAGWAPQWMNSPVQSLEVWGTGGTVGLARLEVFLRPAGRGSGPGTRVMSLDTAVHAPAPQGRYLLNLDSRAVPNGDYELFVRAVTSTGGYSHPNYADSLERFPDYRQLAGAYYPIGVRIQNPAP